MKKEDFSSGLREEYTLTIYMPYFGYDEKYGDHLCFIADGVDEEDEAMHEIFSVGADWETTDGGKTITTPGKPKRTINRSTNYGIWCHAAIDACENSGSDYLDDKDPYAAETWANTIWHMQEKMIREEWTSKGDGVVHPAQYRPMPDQFLGMVEDEKPAAKPAPTAKRDDVAAKREALKAKASTNGKVDDVTAKLISLAKELSQDDFLSAALEMDDVVADDDLAASVVDTTDSGFYAKNH